MTDFEQIYTSYRQEIDDQSRRLNNSQKVEIPRDSLRRPWSPEMDFLVEEKAKDLIDKTVRSAVIDLPWFATAAGVLKYLSLRKKSLVTFFSAGFMAFMALGALIPNRYYSSSHIFVPAKIDSISSRLTSVLDKMEFASLPLDLKMPVMLMAKELETDDAKKWVIDHLQGSVDPSTVYVDAGYALANETLVIQGFGNSPETALQTAQLYKKLFENKVNNLRVGQLEKIDKWADLRLEKINQEIDGIKPRLSTVSTYSSNQQKVVNIRQKLSDKVADLIVKKINLQRLANQVAQAKWSQDLGTLQSVDNTELQESLDVYHGLTDKMAENKSDEKMQALYKQEKNRIEIKIRDMLGTLSQNTQKELNQLDAEISKYQAEVTKYGSQESDIKMANGKENDYGLRIANLENQREDLLKLKNQIQMEISVPSTQYKLVQEAMMDPSARTPHPAVRYGLIFLGAVFVTVIGLIVMQWRRPLNMVKWQTGRKL
jgi:hypothetical protein